MIKSKIGIALAAGAALLLLSPEARKGVRKWAVKGTEFVLDLSEQWRNSGDNTGKESVPEEDSVNAGMPLAAAREGDNEGQFEGNAYKLFPARNVVSDAYIRTQLGNLQTAVQTNGVEDKLIQP